MSDLHRRAWHRRAHSALRHSLRLKLVVVFLLLALGLSAIFLAGMQRAVGAGWREAVEPLLADYVDRLAAEIGSPPSVERARAMTQRLPVSVRIEGPLVQWRSESEGANEWERADGRRHGAAPGLLERVSADGHRVSFGLGEMSWKSQPRLIGWFTLGALLLVIALAYGYVRRLLRPLDDIRVGAQRFGRGEFARPIIVRRPDELGELAGQINTMAHGLHQMLDGKRALLLAVSHELRSPLTRARLHAEMLPESPGSAHTREALLRDLGEMRDLITDLLESERLQGDHAALKREPVDLLGLIREMVADRVEFATVRTNLPASLPKVALDPVRIRLALRNLLDNALRHGAADQAPLLTVVHEPQWLKLTLRDFGPGVQAEQLGRLGEAFYRTDEARQRSTGGVGLGLNLARLVAQAHGGALTFRNADPGLEATLRLPIRAPG